MVIIMIMQRHCFSFSSLYRPWKWEYYTWWRSFTFLNARKLGSIAIHSISCVAMGEWWRKHFSLKVPPWWPYSIGAYTLFFSDERTSLNLKLGQYCIISVMIAQLLILFRIQSELFCTQHLAVIHYLFAHIFPT